MNAIKATSALRRTFKTTFRVPDQFGKGAKIAVGESPSQLQAIIHNPTKVVTAKKFTGQLSRILLDGLVHEKAIEEEIVSLSEDFPEIKLDKGYSFPILFFSGSPLNEEIFLVGLIEVAISLEGQGVGATFLDNMRSVISSCGFRFLAGYSNHFGVARHLVEKTGRRFLEEIIPSKLKPTFSSLLKHQPENDPLAVCFTIGFLNPSEEKDFVEPFLLEASLEHRINFVKQVREVTRLFLIINEILEKGAKLDGAVATIIEILEEFQERGFDLSIDFNSLDSEEESTALILKEKLGTLENAKNRIAKAFPSEELLEFEEFLEDYIPAIPSLESRLICL